MAKNKYDVAIIGSGLSGLAAAYILAKNGRSVAVFEKHSQLGGCLQAFSRKGVKFETGMHYIGSMNEGETLRRYFNFLGLTDNLELSALDPNAYDIIRIGDEEFRFKNGYENFIDGLAERFPNQKTNLIAYTQTIKEAANSSPYHSFQNFNTLNNLNLEFFQNSVDKIVKKQISDTKLQNVLLGNTLLYNGIKNETPFFIPALINDMYIQSSYRIIGGSDAIANALIQSIRSYGGDFFVNSEITKIECDTEKVTAIHTINDERITVNNLISTIHPEILFSRINSSLIRPVFRKRIAALKQTTGAFSIFIKFKPNSVPYLNSNIFRHYSDDILSENQNSTWPNNYLYMHHCTEKNQRYAQSAVILSYMDFSEVEKWQNTTVGKRGDEYEGFKAKKAEKLLQKLELDYPHTRENIEDFWTATPLTYKDYTNTKNGSIYGIQHNISSPLGLSARTKIPNLFLAGQNTNSHGVLGVIISSVIAAGGILEYDKLINDLIHS